MKLRLIHIFISFIFTSVLTAQDSIPKAKGESEYSFIFVDSPNMSTMKLFNENYLSVYRLGINSLNSVVSAEYSSMIQAVLTGLFLLPLTHEEGHRTILTNEGIGSISQPYYNRHLAAYVKGVTDAQLKNLRDTKFPVYIRLHTAGLESDYALLLRSASLMNWHEETKNVLLTEYLMRKLSLISYYGMGLLKIEGGLKEEENELDRDIVGNDVYGAIRHLHRPEMTFYRYTNYSDLTSTEKRFIKRVGFRSLFNLIDPLLWGKTCFNIKGYNVNFSGGYGMAPFGDYLDQHFWLMKNKLKTHVYLREYENNKTWYPAFGLYVTDIGVYQRVSTDVAIHAWGQPKDLKFKTDECLSGGAVDFLLKYRLLRKTNKIVNGISANLGITAKTKGFLAEESSLDSHVGLRLGISIWVNRNR